MHSFTHHDREILGLKQRAVTCLVDNYSFLFHGRDQFLDHIPKIFRKEIFTRLVFKGILEVPLFQRIVDQMATIVDLKSASSGVNNAACLVLKRFPNLRTLYLNQVSANSKAMCNMFSTMHRLSALEITNSPNFDDAVVKVLSEACPCLKILNASKSGMTDKGMESMGQNSLSLVALDISHTNVSYCGIQSLFASPTLGTLKELKCRGSKIICREDILGTIEGFQRLEEYCFDFESSGDATWVLSRVTKRLKNCSFHITL